GKKIYYKGEDKSLNADTGEINQLDVIKQEIKHSQKYSKAWGRVYIFQLFDTLLDLCGNSAKLRVIDFILSHLDENNNLNMNLTQDYEKIQAKERAEGNKSITSWATINKICQTWMAEKAGTKNRSIYMVNHKTANAFGSDSKKRAK
ncbi:replication/maintenance protein RepL, partial [Helicobacter pylori]|uniref:replication/maintenance protein RepL n=1 Tax=Helicobacter pylori TaxID=210 RepID=UPI000D474674